jgi:hypothetical protein
MAYDPVSQANRDVLSEGSDPLTSGSPLPYSSFHPVAMEFEDLGGDFAIEAEPANGNENTRLGSMIRSMASTGTSYDMVEDDDYEDSRQTPVKGRSRDPGLGTSPQPHSFSPKDTGWIRTASIGPKMPLRHPTPDLQSVQGGYLKNVERLEESAERLSMTTSLEDELPRMKFEQPPAPVGGPPSVHLTSRQVSEASPFNPHNGMDASPRSACLSPFQPIVSRKGSLLSQSWTHTSNPECPTSKGLSTAQSSTDHHIGQDPLESAPQDISPRLEPPQPPPHTTRPENHARRASVRPTQACDVGDATEVRPSTSASHDTYRQATTLFVDFDGVHYTSHSHLSPSRQGSLNRQIPISQPPLAADATTFSEPPSGEPAVYYPAPVPMMLNLPQKLSKLPAATERERRRLKTLNAIPSEVRKSAAWLNGEEKPTLAEDLQTSQALSSAPPQIRASAFFDQPGVGQDVHIKGASAVDTLDSILDASANAPVSAFTDHPFAGHLGGEVYKSGKGRRKSATIERKKKRPTSITESLRTSTGLALDTNFHRPVSAAANSVMSQNKLTDRRSKIGMNGAEAALVDGEDTPPRMSADVEDAVGQSAKFDPDIDEEQREEEDEEEGKYESEESDTPAYGGPPTTLLAELQMRKAQQRLRNRTAANAFPNGMRSTLLELDAVAQVQQKSRKKKHITLAWEDHEVAEAGEFDDDDIPLGLLAAGPKAQQTFNRPVGLMERREMEDNEPLSRRRARLRGDGIAHAKKGPWGQPRASTMHTLDVPLQGDNVLEEGEGETLAQRIQRIKSEKGTATGIGAEFLNEVSSQLGLKTENVAPEVQRPEGEETLGQRRKRLQEEALKSSGQRSGGGSQHAFGIKALSSMADILTHHPTPAARQPSGELKGFSQHTTLAGQNAQQDGRPNYVPSFQPPMKNPHLVPGVLPSCPSFHAGMSYMNGGGGFNHNESIMYSPGLAMQRGVWGQNGYVHDPMMMGPPLDPKQREMIDRWRQSVAQ